MITNNNKLHVIANWLVANTNFFFGETSTTSHYNVSRKNSHKITMNHKISSELNVPWNKIMIIEYGIEVFPWGSGHVQFVKNDGTFNKEGLRLKHQGSSPQTYVMFTT